MWTVKTVHITRDICSKLAKEKSKHSSMKLVTLDGTANFQQTSCLNTFIVNSDHVTLATCQSKITCSMLIIETPEQCVKYVQSY